MSAKENNGVYDNFIGGEWKPATSRRTYESVNPANARVVGCVSLSDEEDVREAVAAANEAKGKWRAMSGAERGEILYQAAEKLAGRLNEIAETMTEEMGKTLPEAKGEVKRGIDLLRYYAGEGIRKIGDVIPSNDRSAFMYTTRVPLGVVGVITPWNFPVAIPVWKIAPALIYGNTVVFKPALESAVTAAKVVECLAEAGLPDGVLNMVNGEGAVVGQAILEHPDISGITFTGSDRTGKKVAEAAVARGAKYQLEMGGKNPVIIAEDAKLDQAVDAVISGAFRSTGQKCTATSRVIVHRRVLDEFKSKLLEKTKALTIGDGLESGTWMGPCASERQMETVLSYIRKGVEEGAELLCGGKRLTAPPYDKGFFVEPAVFDNVKSDMTIAQEEIFGPVVMLMPYDSLEEAVELANDVKYGLSASIYTQNIEAILSFIDRIEAGLVRVNSETAGVELQAPFGGMKQSSSHSREQGQAAIEFFTAIKTVSVKA